MAQRDYEEDDDRPGKRRRFDDDEDYEDDDDRPRRRSKSGGSTSALTIGLIVGGVAVLGLCVVGILIGLLLPAVSKVRNVSARAQEQNNLKQIGLGMHNEHDLRNQWVVPFAQDDKGQIHRGHSFRVGILPFVEQEALYRTIDMTQPWNSPRNQPMTSTSIPIYSTPLDKARSSNTPYRAFVGGRAMFTPDGKPVRLPEITDGTSNTLLLVHAKQQVPWAEPNELAYSPTAPIPPLGHAGLPGGSNVLFADGSVRFMPTNVPEATLRSLITPDDGQMPMLDW